MPFDDAKFDKLATQGSVAGVALYVSFAIDTIVVILEQIADGEKPSAEAIKDLREYSEKLSEQFNILTGWVRK